MNDQSGSVVHMKDFSPQDFLYAAGRVCADPDCITRLCRYNPGPLCFCHQAKREGRRFEPRRHVMEQAA